MTVSLSVNYSITRTVPETKVVSIAFASRQLVPFQLCATHGLGISTGEKEQGVYSTEFMGQGYVLDIIWSVYRVIRVEAISASSQSRHTQCFAKVYAELKLFHHG